jgi:hypothetical protein
MRDSKIGKVTGTWGGILTGVAAILTAVGLNVTDTSDEQAQRADEKSELVLDLFRDRFNTAEADRLRMQKELEYYRAISAKLLRMVDELEDQLEGEGAPAPDPEPPAPVWTPTRIPARGAAKSSKGSIMEDPLAAALDDMDPEDQFDLPEPPPEAAPPPQQQQMQLPENLEDILPKKAK